MRDNGFQKPYSEETASMIDHEVRQLVSDSYEQSKNILRQNKTQLTKVAEMLLEKEVIFKDDLEKILGKRGGNEVLDKKERSRVTALNIQRRYK
jgi:AFG3 family protein